MVDYDDYDRSLARRRLCIGGLVLLLVAGGWWLHSSLEDRMRSENARKLSELEAGNRRNQPDAPNGKSVSGTQPKPGPLADATGRVRNFEQKRALVESLLGKALAERDDLAAKLRAVGVNSPADLKGNVRGQRLAEIVGRIAQEIDGLERQLSSLDAEVFKAKAVVRRMEREQAGISEEEMRQLGEQLREAEERLEGTASPPVTPLDVEEALKKALEGGKRKGSKSESGGPPTKANVGVEVPKGEFGPMVIPPGGYATQTGRGQGQSGLTRRTLPADAVKAIHRVIPATDGNLNWRVFRVDAPAFKGWVVTKEMPTGLVAPPGSAEERELLNRPALEYAVGAFSGTLRRDRRDFTPASFGTIYLLANADAEFGKTGVELARITRPGTPKEVQSGRTLFIYFTQD